MTEGKGVRIQANQLEGPEETESLLGAKQEGKGLSCGRREIKGLKGMTFSSVNLIASG